jgi:hypothetical protein|tara:strand:- start:838 stop:1065 length:228 start_codon:yes stop_codon:yes gene_type:complete
LTDPPRLLVSSACWPPARNWSRHFEIEIAEVPSRRAVSTIVISPRNTASTILSLSSMDFVGWWPVKNLLQVSTKP